MKVELDTTDQQYVIYTGRSASLMSFTSVYAVVCELARRLAKSGKQFAIPLASEIGSITQYRQYQSMMNDYACVEDSDLWMDDRTPTGVRKALRLALRSQTKIRLFYGDTKTGRDWLSTHEVVGRLSHTDDWLKVPVLVDDQHSYAMSISTGDIVKILDLDNAVTLYELPRYHQPQIRIVASTGLDEVQGKVYSVEAQEESLSDDWMSLECFEDEKAAQGYLSFVTGATHVYPTLQR